MINNTTIIKESYKVIGMTCASCAISLESYLKPIEGIQDVLVNYPNQSVVISYDSAIISIETISSKANEISYSILIPNSEDNIEQLFETIEAKKLAIAKKKLIFAIAFSVPIFIISMFLMGMIPYENWIQLLLSTPVVFWAGSEFYTNAYKRIKHFSSNMDTLVALSTGIAYLYSVFNTFHPSFMHNRGLHPHVYYESAVVIITLILLGRYLEEQAKGKTSSAIKDLMGLTPKSALVIRNGEEIELPINEIIKGDLIIVKPGSKIPIDGTVKKGDSYVDESMITGEPIPDHKQKGSKVFAGTINQKGSLRILSLGTEKNTLIAQIIKQVKIAQSSKPKIQRIADKTAGIFVPIVIVLATISALTWYFIGPDPNITYSITTLITVLIIACPCALGLATPTALMVGIGKGAQNGILVKNADALEKAYKIDVLILDKTGTITEGKPSVTHVLWEKDSATIKNKEILYTIESQSEHPIANAIKKYLNSANLQSVSAHNFKSITGKGAQIEFEGNKYFVGNREFVESNALIMSDELKSDINQTNIENATVVYFGGMNQILATIAITDEIKSDSKAAISTLNKLGVDIYMLTGDDWNNANYVASQVGIVNIKAKVLPNEKGEFVKQLQKEGKIVAMAGDGINDSHALAQSDVGIAMGSGTDIAMESANVTLIYSNLNQVVKLIQLSSATMRTIYQNLFWAFIYNLIAIPIAAGVLYPNFGFLLNPMIAGAAMSLSSISVLLNSLYLKRQSLDL